MDTIKASALYRDLSAGRKNVEVWEDNFTDGQWAYYSIVAFGRGEIDILANVRVQDGALQQRTSRPEAEETWADVA